MGDTGDEEPKQDIADADGAQDGPAGLIVDVLNRPRRRHDDEKHYGYRLPDGSETCIRDTDTATMEERKEGKRKETDTKNGGRGQGDATIYYVCRLKSSQVRRGGARPLSLDLTPSEIARAELSLR